MQFNNHLPNAYMIHNEIRQMGTVEDTKMKYYLLPLSSGPFILWGAVMNANNYNTSQNVVND